MIRTTEFEHPKNEQVHVHINEIKNITAKVCKIVESYGIYGCTGAQVLIALGENILDSKSPGVRAVLANLSSNSSKVEGSKQLLRMGSIDNNGNDIVLYTNCDKKLKISPCYLCGKSRQRGEWKIQGGSYGPCKITYSLKRALILIMCEDCFRSNINGDKNPVPIGMVILPPCYNNCSGALHKFEENIGLSHRSLVSVTTFSSTNHKNVASISATPTFGAHIRKRSSKMSPEEIKPEVLAMESKDGSNESKTSGWLLKKGGVIFQTWQQRWFTLSKYQLAYYSSERANGQNGNARRVIDLKSFTIKHSVKDSDKLHPYTMVLAEADTTILGRSYLMAAESEQEEKAWINSITAVINNLNLR